MAWKPANHAAQGPTIWGPIEAEQIELEDYMNQLLAARVAAEPPFEHEWLREALEESWPRVLSEVDAAVC